MSEPGDQPETPSPEAAPTWRELWQAPAMVGAVVVLVAGIALAIATRPRPDLSSPLERAAALIDGEQHREAVELLNRRVFPYLDTSGEGLVETRRRYQLLIGRAIAEGQRALGVDLDENHVAVIRAYQEAERLGQALGPRDLENLARSYLARGEHEIALRRAAGIGAEDQDRRDRVYKQVVESWVGSGVPRLDRAMELLGELLADPAVSTEHRVWALETRARVQVRQGFVDEAIADLVRSMPRVELSADAGELARLHLQLGQAYLQQGALRDAERHAARAIELSGEDDPARPHAMLVLAGVFSQRGEASAARDLYGQIDDRFTTSDAYGAALLGLGEVNAALGSTEASLGAYERLVEHARTRVNEPEPTREAITQSLLARYLDQTTVREHATALRYAELAERLYADDGSDAPAEVIQAIADGHRVLADGISAPGDGAVAPDLAERLELLDPSARAEAQRHLIRAGALYRDLADRYVLTDNDRFADAVWEGALQFDRAGDLASAIEAYREFVRGVPGDPRHAEARYRLGRTHQAMGEYEAAAGHYRELIEEQRSGQGADVGPFAVASYVPLAQCYQLDADPNNDAQSEELLQAAVSGSLATIDARAYRDALVELGSLHYRRGNHERAIERLNEALARYPDDEDADELIFRRADSMRLLADRIDQALEEPMPEGERRELAHRATALRQEALAGFERAAELLGGREPRSLTTLDRLHLRNSLFYQGDCAFDLGDYEGAIQRYDAARERYPDDPASLIAMVQIVNAYVEQGDLRRARTANERARRFYLELPDEAWSDPNLPMGREDWERWLQSSSQLYEVADR